MRLEVGDMVQSRSHGKVGVVIRSRPSNGNLTDSLHAHHLVSSYPQVYYVFFSEDEPEAGPFYSDDLHLKVKYSPHSV
jgi:hypothetical protein